MEMMKKTLELAKSQLDTSALEAMISKAGGNEELIERLRYFACDPMLGGIIEEAADRIEELERDLLNLVCRIHRDGGHYIAKYGEAKAIADADTVAAQNNADLDALQADNAGLVAALERMRVAGGSQEFHTAWELAKDVLDKVRKPWAKN